MNTQALFDRNNVMSAYHGRAGCMCGCRGKYSYAKAYQVQAGKDRGYDVADGDVSDRSVSIITGKLAKHYLNDPTSIDIDPNGQYAAWDDGEKTLCIYFADRAKVVALVNEHAREVAQAKRAADIVAKANQKIEDAAWAMNLA